MPHRYHQDTSGNEIVDLLIGTANSTSPAVAPAPSLLAHGIAGQANSFPPCDGVEEDGLSVQQHHVQSRLALLWSLCRKVNDPYGKETADFWVIFDPSRGNGDLAVSVFPLSWGSAPFRGSPQYMRLRHICCRSCGARYQRCACVTPSIDPAFTRIMIGGIKEEAKFWCLQSAVFRLAGICIQICRREKGVVFAWVLTDELPALRETIHRKVWWSPLGIVSARTPQGYDFLASILDDLRAQRIRCPFPRNFVTINNAGLPSFAGAQWSLPGASVPRRLPIFSADENLDGHHNRPYRRGLLWPGQPQSLFVDATSPPAVVTIGINRIPLPVPFISNGNFAETTAVSSASPSNTLPHKTSAACGHPGESNLPYSSSHRSSPPKVMTSDSSPPEPHNVSDLAG